MTNLRSSLGEFRSTKIIHISTDYVYRGEQARPIGQAHGSTIDAQASYGPIKIVVLYHPAVAVYNSNTLPELERDFAVLREFV